MKALDVVIESYNFAINQNTTVGRELDEIRRGINYAGTFYQEITRAINRIKEGEQTKEMQDPSSQAVLASILADIEGASRETIGQVQEISEIQGNEAKQQKEEIDRDDSGR